MSEFDFTTLLTFILASLGVVLAVVFVWYVLQVIAYWRIFAKAGEPGWKSLIPVYNDYVMFKIVWQPKFFWVTLLVSFVSSFLFNYGEPGSALVTVSYLLFFVAAAFEVVCIYKLSKAFGHGVPFAVGLFFLAPIFRLILAFSGDTYQGPQ